MPVISRPRNGRGSFLVTRSTRGEDSRPRSVPELPDVVNHRCLQDSEEPVLLGVLWPFLYFSPGRWWWREGGKQVSRLQDNVLVILSALIWGEGSITVQWSGSGEWVGVGRYGGGGKGALFCFGFLETVSPCGSYYPGTLNPASVSTVLELQVWPTIVGKATLSGQCQLSRNDSQGQLTSNEPDRVGPMGLGFLGLKNPGKDRAAGGGGSSPAHEPV